MPRLDIETYFLEELLVKNNFEYDGAAPPSGAAPSVDFDFFRKEDADPQFLVKLLVEVGEGSESNLPYHVRISLFAAFDSSADPDHTLVEQLVAANAAPILYGIARGIVGQATAQGFNGRYVLPTVNFIDLAKSKAASMAATEHPSSGAV